MYGLEEDGKDIPIPTPLAQVQAAGNERTALIDIYMPSIRQAKAVVRQNKIPFEIAVDPFYNETNQAHLRKAIADLEAGKGQFHDLIEAENE